MERALLFHALIASERFHTDDRKAIMVRILKEGELRHGHKDRWAKFRHGPHEADKRNVAL